MAQCSATEGEDFESKVPVHITLSYGMSLTKLRADKEISNIRAQLGEQRAEQSAGCFTSFAYLVSNRN